MKNGTEYLYSRQKEYFDQRIATLLMPAYKIAKLGAAATFGFAIYEDARVGQNGEIIDIPKIQTLDDDGVPLSMVANSFRQKGFDELPQLELVMNGVMSIVGTRHLLPNEYDQMRDIAGRTNRGKLLLAKHDVMVRPAKRGLISSFALHAHIHGESDVEQRLSLDIQDHALASLRYDTLLIANVLRSTALNELTNGINPIKS